MENRAEFFSTEELRRLYPGLDAREDSYGGQDYVVFTNPGKFTNNAAPEWPIGIELWIGHMHERNVDGQIYDPLRFYPDMRGRTEDLFGTVYGEIGTMAEVLTQHLYAAYKIDVIFGILVELPGMRRRLLIKNPSEIESLLDASSGLKPYVMVRILNDERFCAINGTPNESCNVAYRCFQYADGGFRKYDFLIYPLTGIVQSSRAETISAKAYVHFYAAIYESVVMLAHHKQAWRK